MVCRIDGEEINILELSSCGVKEPAKNHSKYYEGIIHVFTNLVPVISKGKHNVVTPRSVPTGD
jgi:hypothetical protein